MAGSSKRRRAAMVVGIAVVSTVILAVVAWRAAGTPGAGRDRGLLQDLAPPQGGPLYIALPPIKDETSSPEVAQLAEQVIREQLTRKGATFAPAGETPEAARTLLRDQGRQGWQLVVKLHPEDVKGVEGIKIDVVCLTYPDLLMRGAANVKAGGAKPATLIKAMVPKVMADIAAECEWAL